MKSSICKFLAVLFFIGWLYSSGISISAEINQDYKVYVMAPLSKVNDWNDFSKQLITLKENGVYGLTTDIWWGDVEANGDNQFDWSYYKQYAQIVRESGLKWVPIISTHQCGGNVGDDCNVPIPNWIWNLASEGHLTQKSETGYVNKETISPWAGDIIEEQYDELYQSFAENFSEYSDIISKIYISAGAAGELRYSSYVPSAGWEYPERGEFQAYSDTAITEFRNSMKSKYQSLSTLNNAWGTNLTSWNEVHPPTDGDNFFTSRAAYESQYGEDFLTWYQTILMKHLDLIGELAHNNFDPSFNVPIGAKIAGIHWKMEDPNMPNSAEYSAGYYSYDAILDQFKETNLELTFTALEMDDSNANVYPHYSAPKSLVMLISKLANEKGLIINGENALAISSTDSEYSISRYNNIAQHLFNENFSAFTLLRINTIVNRDGSTTNEMVHFRDILLLNPIEVEFIVKNAPTNFGDTVYITGSRWEMGMWNHSDGEMIELNWDNTNKDWRGKGYIAADRYYEFKALIKDTEGNIREWESGENNKWVTPIGNSDYTLYW